MDASELADREMICDCLARISRGEDRRDAHLLRASYWPDAMFEFGIFSGDLEAYLAWVVPGSPAVTNTLHTLGQTVFAFCGTRAATETHVTCYHRVNFGAEEPMSRWQGAISTGWRSATANGVLFTAA